MMDRRNATKTMYGVALAAILGKPRATNPVLADETGQAVELAQKRLTGWKQALENTSEIHASFVKSTVTAVFKTRKTELGQVSLSRAGLMRIDVADERGNPIEAVVWDAKGHEWHTYKSKMTTVYTRPESGEKRSDPFEPVHRAMNEIPQRFGFLFLGADWDDLAKVFNLRVTDASEKNLTIELEPRDKPERTLMRKITLLFDGSLARPNSVILVDSVGNVSTCRIQHFRGKDESTLSEENLRLGLPENFTRRATHANVFSRTKGKADAKQRPLAN